MSRNTASELTYRSEIQSHGSHRMSRVLPLGLQSVPLNANSITEVQIELPNKVYNLSKSSLDFQVQVDAGADFNNIHNLGATMIDRVTLYTREGVNLLDIPNFAEYSRSVTPLVTKMKDYLDNSTSLGDATSILANARDKGHQVHRSNADLTAVPGAGLTRSGARVSSTAVLGVEAPSVAFTEFQYLKQSTTATDAFVNMSIPLSEIHHSICSLDKDYFFDQSLILRVHFASIAKLGWRTASATDLVTGETNIASAVNVNNIRVYLAVENNPDVVDDLMSRARSQGLKLNVPYVYGYQFSSPIGTNSSVQQRLNSGFGHALLNTYHAIFNTTSSGRLAYDIDNVAVAGVPKKLVSFQTKMDQQNLQEIVVQSAENEDYEFMRRLLKGSTIQDSNVYQYNRVWCDSFRAGPCADWKDMDGDLDGLDLSSERIWSIDQTTASAPYRQHSWFVIQREMMLQPDGQVMIR